MRTAASTKCRGAKFIKKGHARTRTFQGQLVTIFMIRVNLLLTGVVRKIEIVLDLRTERDNLYTTRPTTFSLARQFGVVYNYNGLDIIEFDFSSHSVHPWLVAWHSWQNNYWLSWYEIYFKGFRSHHIN